MSEPAGKLILLIEDDSFLRQLAEASLQQLKPLNFEIATASTAAEAKKLMQERTPDLILLDIILPDQNGFDMLAELRKDERYKSLPVIIFSNLGQRADLERAKELGVLSFHVKANTSLDNIREEVKRAVLGQ